MNKAIATTGVLLLCAGGAWAQTSVTVYGVADVFLNFTRSGATRLTQLKEGGLAASRLGFRGTEDLGGGNYANFVLEAGYRLDDGSGTLPGPNLMFTRRSSVGIGGPWGRIDAGRMLIPAFYGMARADPFKVNGIFSQLNLLAQPDAQKGLGGAFAFRANNMIRYGSPTGKPFTVDVYYSPGEVATPNDKSAESYGGNFAYDSQPYFIAYSFQKFRSGTPAAPVPLPVTSNFDVLSAAYMVNASLQIGGNYVRISSSDASIPSAKLFNGGVIWNLGSSTISVALSKRDVAGSPRTQRGMTLGYDYALSKRTSLYARYLSLDNKANASASLAGVAVTADSGNDTVIEGSNIG